MSKLSFKTSKGRAYVLIKQSVQGFACLTLSAGIHSKFLLFQLIIACLSQIGHGKEFTLLYFWLSFAYLRTSIISLQPSLLWTKQPRFLPSFLTAYVMLSRLLFVLTILLWSFSSWPLSFTAGAVQNWTFITTKYRQMFLHLAQRQKSSSSTWGCCLPVLQLCDTFDSWSVYDSL